MCISAIFLTGKSFGADVQARVVSPVALVQLEDVETDALLRCRVSLDHHITFLPDFFPLLFVRADQCFPTLLFGGLRFVHRILHQLLTVALQRGEDGNIFFQSHPVTRFHIGTGAESCQFFLFYFDGTDMGGFAVFIKPVSHAQADL